MNIFPGDWLVVLPIIIPLGAALLSLLNRRLPSFPGIVAGLMVFASALGLIRQLQMSGPLDYHLGGWLPPLGISLRLDALSAVMVLMTAVTGLGVSFYARGYFQSRIVIGSNRQRHIFQQRSFWPLWLLLWAALNSLFLSADLFNIYVNLELIGLSSAALTALSGKPASQSAAMRYLLVSLLGSMSYLLGIAFLYKVYATLDLATLREIITPLPLVFAAVSLITLGLLLKTALFPLHFWLPPAHANALAPVSAILSGLVVKSSWYLLFRFWFDLFAAIITGQAPVILAVFGAMAIFWGSFQALTQQRLKMLVAYSTVAQLGYLFLIFPLVRFPADSSGLRAALYFAVSHSFAKAAMFLAAGSIFLQLGHDRIRDLAGIRQQLPVSSFAFAIAGLSIMGLPPSGGFIAKYHYLNIAIQQDQWPAVLAIIGGSLLAMAYVFRVVNHLLNPGNHLPVTAVTISPAMQWSSLALALISMLLGLTPYQFFLPGGTG